MQKRGSLHPDLIQLQIQNKNLLLHQETPKNRYFDDYKNKETIQNLIKKLQDHGSSMTVLQTPIREIEEEEERQR